MGECENDRVCCSRYRHFDILFVKTDGSVPVRRDLRKKYGCQYQNVSRIARDLIEHLIRSGNSVCRTGVGIAVPQMVKRLFRTAKPIIMIPACFLGGAVFCMFCDLLARMVFAPTEMSISTVTAIFGAPVMIAVMLKQRQERY